MSAPVEQVVQVPRALLRGVAAQDVAVWVALASHRNYGAPGRPVWPSRQRIASAIGRPEGDLSAITRATGRLARGEWLSKDWARRGARTLTTYRLYVLAEGEAYVALPLSALDVLAGGVLSPEALLELLRWRDACGGNGRTSDSLADHARRYGVHMATARRHRLRLVQLGLLGTAERPGMSSETTVPGLAEGPDRFTAGPLTNSPDHPSQIRQTTPHEFARAPLADSPEDPSQIRHTERPPVERPPEDRSPGERAAGQSSVVSLADARAERTTDETDEVAAVVAYRLRCAAPLAGAVVESIRLQFAPSNLRSYVGRMPDEDLRRVLHALPEARRHLHEERQARQAAQDAARKPSAPPASPETVANAAAAARRALRQDA